MSNFPNRGYYRGNLDALIEESKRLVDSMSPEQLEEMKREQAKSWARGEAGTGNDRQEAAARAAYLAEQTEVQYPSSPRAMGYTGNTCTNCQSTRMMVAGHCEVCLDCGTSSGCS